MAVNVVRYRHGDRVHWGVVEGNRISPVEGDYATTRAFMLEGAARVRREGAMAAHNPRRLRPDDLVEASIRTDDGALDLGVQRNRVVAKAR